MLMSPVWAGGLLYLPPTGVDFVPLTYTIFWIISLAVRLFASAPAACATSIFSALYTYWSCCRGHLPATRPRTLGGV